MKIVLSKDKIEKIVSDSDFTTVLLHNGGRLQVPASSKIVEKQHAENRRVRGVSSIHADVFAKLFQISHRIPSEAIRSSRCIGTSGMYDIYLYSWVEITEEGRAPEPTPESLRGGLGVDGAGVSKAIDAAHSVDVGLESPVTRAYDVFEEGQRKGKGVEKG